MFCWKFRNIFKLSKLQTNGVVGIDCSHLPIFIRNVLPSIPTSIVPQLSYNMHPNSSCIPEFMSYSLRNSPHRHEPKFCGKKVVLGKVPLENSSRCVAEAPWVKVRFPHCLLQSPSVYPRAY